MVRISSLVAIATGCGIGLVCMKFAVDKQRETLVNRTAFLTRAINLMRAQPNVTNLLGDNITVGKATLQDDWSKVESSADVTQIQLRLPVKGEKDIGYLFAFGRKKSDMEKYKLYKLEMTFGEVKNKKLVLLDLDAVDSELDKLLAGEDKKEKKKDS